MQTESNDRLENEFKERPFYDRLYTTEKSVFGGPQGIPERFVEHLGSILKSGLVLEVGAGQGRNALWLARRGISVEASDISEVGVMQMNNIALSESLPLVAIVVDLREPIAKEYDAIVGTYVFHHVPKEEAVAVLQDFKEHTKIGGYNVIAAFTTEGDFYSKNSSTLFWYPKPGELKDLYRGWEIIHYEESSKKALAKGKDGAPMINTVARIVAKKL